MGRKSCPVCGDILNEDLNCEGCGFSIGDMSKDDFEKLTEVDEPRACGKNCDDCPLKINVAVFLNK